MSRILSLLVIITLLIPTFETIVSQIEGMTESGFCPDFIQETEEERTESEEEEKKEKEIDELFSFKYQNLSFPIQQIRYSELEHIRHSWITEIPSPPPKA